MSSLHAGSPDVHANAEQDNVDRDSEPGSNDSDINVDSNSEIKFCLNMMSMEKALQSATTKVEAGNGNWKLTNLPCKEGSFQVSCASCHLKFSMVNPPNFWKSHLTSSKCPGSKRGQVLRHEYF